MQLLYLWTYTYPECSLDLCEPQDCFLDYLYQSVVKLNRAEHVDPFHVLSLSSEESFFFFKALHQHWCYRNTLYWFAVRSGSRRPCQDPHYVMMQKLGGECGTNRSVHDDLENAEPDFAPNSGGLDPTALWRSFSSRLAFPDNWQLRDTDHVKPI